MSADDAVRIANLIGSGVLFIGALRGQRWTKKQAATQEEAARTAPGANGAQPAAGGERAGSESKPPPTTASAGKPVLAKPGQFEADAAKIGAQPYFDRPAYWIFCIGFAITTLASGIDLYGHHTFSHVFGASASEMECQCAPSPLDAKPRSERAAH